MLTFLTPLRSLLVLQFLSAFVDNMLLFIAQAIIMRDQYPAYYLSLVQSMYLASYIIASPWVGHFADSVPKARVLIIGNGIKALTLVLMLFSVNPALSYLCFGLGSVIYSPGKYGILPFLAKSDKELMQANAWLESSTIVAILLGSVAGGYLSDKSIPLAASLGLFLYALSMLCNILIPANPVKYHAPMKKAFLNFFSDIRFFLTNIEGRFSVLGSAYFWVMTSILRLAIFVWAPEALGLTGNTPISLLIALIGIGMGIGAYAAPYVLSLKTYRRAIWLGMAMSVLVLILVLTKSLALTLVLLLLSGVLGGLYIVPVNSLNESVGEATIGAGRGVAVQNFAENTLMLVGTSLYTMTIKSGVAIEPAILGTGVVFFLLMLHLVHLTPKTKEQAE